MYRNFDPRTATITVRNSKISIPKRDGTSSTVDGITVNISSDFGNGQNHKCQLYVNEKSLSSEIENCWKSVKDISNKIVGVFVYFNEIDYYDNMTNIYNTPVISIQKGQRIIHIDKKEHGSIPKDWEITLLAKFEKVQRITPIISLIEKVLGPYFTTQMSKDFEKESRSVLQGKTNEVIFNLSND